MTGHSSTGAVDHYTRARITVFLFVVVVDVETAALQNDFSRTYFSAEKPGITFPVPKYVQSIPRGAREGQGV